MHEHNINRIFNRNLFEGNIFQVGSKLASSCFEREEISQGIISEVLKKFLDFIIQTII